jgi:hypothetical protein
MPNNLQTDIALIERLRAAAKRGVSLAERKQQRLSFVYGNLPKGSAMSKVDVERALSRIDLSEGQG